MLLAATADLHWGHNRTGDRSTRALAEEVASRQPEVFVIAGDVGTDEHFGACLRLFSELPRPKLLVPGNHDVWTNQPAPDSLALYEEHLPRLAGERGFHYLDAAPYVSPDGREAIVGSMNWYDYSYADPAVEREFPNAREMYRAKLFPRGRHNDGRFVRFGMTDEEFTARVVRRFREQLAALPESVERVTVVQHHPPVRELFYPRPLASVEGKFWLAYTGNRSMAEAVLADPRVRTVLCGHTHASVVADVQGRRCINLGGDYDRKRLLLLDTEAGMEEAEKAEAWQEF